MSGPIPQTKYSDTGESLTDPSGSQGRDESGQPDSPLPSNFNPADYFDVSEWPVAVINPPEPMSDDELITILDAFHKVVMEKGGPYTCINDLRRSSGMPSRQRKLLTKKLKEAEAATGGACKGVALIFKSELLRGVLMAIMWVFKPKCPTSVFNDLEEAKTFCRGITSDFPN